jgi:hypothetical protein
VIFPRSSGLGKDSQAWLFEKGKPDLFMEQPLADLVIKANGE